MNGERWERVKAIFHQALERDPAERAAFLAEACGGDAEVRAELDRLLAAQREAGTFLEWSPMAAVAPAGQQCALTPGRAVGRYKIGPLLGRGGMGQVYAAHDTDLGRDVAIKVVTATDAEAQAALRREAQHASQLNHPHICTIYEVGDCDGQAFFAMEFVKGPTLDSLIPTGGLPAETAVRYGIQIADALAHAHRRGVVHRDLKAANVVVTSEGNLKVLDFGLALRVPTERLGELTRSRDPLDRAGIIAGTLPYMSPELLRGERADARSDIWALGVLLYELTTGQRPFEGGTGFELSAAILHQPPRPLPEHVPASLQAIIRRCLAKDRATRYGDAIEIRSALDAVHAARASGVAAAASSATSFVRRPVVIALALLAVIAVGATVTWRLRPPEGVPVAAGAGGRPAIAVMDFENAAGGDDTAWLSTGVPTMLLTGLAQTRGLDIVSAQRLHEALEQAGHGDFASIDKSQQADVARRAGAGAVVVGSIFRAGPDIRIDAQVEDLTTGLVLAAESVRGTDLFALVDQLAARIRGGVGFRDDSQIRNIAAVSSTSVAAYRLYSEGLNARVNLRWDEAQRLFERAIAIDPAFAEAHLQAAVVARNVGRIAARRDHVAKAADNIDRLSERSRLLLEVELARINGDATRTAQLLDEIIARFPDEEEAYVAAAQLYAPIGGSLPSRAKQLEVARAGVTALPTSTQTRNSYGYALLAAGRPAEALHEFETYARLAPYEPNPFDSMGDAYLTLGLPDKAIDSYSKSLSLDPTFSHNGRAFALAILGRYDEAIAEEPVLPHLKAVLLSRTGRYREADRALATAIEIAKENENVERAASLHLLSAVHAIERRDYGRALRECRAAEKIFAATPDESRRSGSVLTDLVTSIAELASGSRPRARARLDAQTRAYQPEAEIEKRWRRLLEGEIALAAGDGAAATAAFSAAEPSQRVFNLVVAQAAVTNWYRFRDGPARAAEARGDLSTAIRVYRQLLSSGSDQPWMAPLEPRYVLEIARLLLRTGDTAGARVEYLRFLDLWKHADADLPELDEARRAVSRLVVSGP
jgi:tetratricopeptide (TPR) repeat protein/predicted Ser/Thr protein kinase